MHNFILSILAILLTISGVLFFFYYRDVLNVESEVVEYGCKPINLQIQDITSSSFRVKWETIDECLGLVKYGESIDSIQ